MREYVFKKFWIRGFPSLPGNGNQFGRLVTELGLSGTEDLDLWFIPHLSARSHSRLRAEQEDCVTQSSKAFWWLLIEMEAPRLCLMFQQMDCSGAGIFSVNSERQSLKKGDSNALYISDIIAPPWPLVTSFLPAKRLTCQPCPSLHSLY